MSRYGGILGGGHLPSALSLLVLGGGVRMANSLSECVTFAREIKLCSGDRKVCLDLWVH